MDNYTAIDCKHCVYHYVYNRRERPIGDEWCARHQCVKVKDDDYADRSEEDFIIIKEEDLR